MPSGILTCTMSPVSGQVSPPEISPLSRMVLTVSIVTIQATSQTATTTASDRMTSPGSLP